jgi:hypothetical protein
MADTIKIKRSNTTATPATLAAGELAYSETSGNLFIGKIVDGTPVVIGGAGDHTKLAGIESGAQVNTVTSVAGRTGSVVVASTDLADFSTAADARIAAAHIADLADVAGTVPSDGQILTWSAAGSTWAPAAAGTGVTTFVALNDTPTAFTGAGGYFVKVNAGATALEFVSAIDGGSF